MSLFSSIKKGGDIAPPRILLYGVAGVGKSTFAAGAPNPIFLPTEEGMGLLKADSFPLIRSYADMMTALGELYTEKHNYQTVVVDSLDWLEPLVWQKVCEDNKIKSIEDLGYGKGYTQAIDRWREYLDGINALRDHKGMSIVQIAHSHIKRFDSPTHDSYDRYEIKLHAKASALVQEHSDCVFFANYRVSTTEKVVGFNKKVTRAVGGGERVLYTEERPAYLAKNRYGLPDILPLDWTAFSEAVNTNINNAAKEQ
jgi:hypothetical protein